MRNEKYPRREILQSIGIGAVVSAGVASPVVAEGPKKKVKREDGKERREIIKSSKESNETKKLLSYVKNSGWEIQNKETAVILIQESSKPKEQYHMLIAPLRYKKEDDTNESRALIWHNNPNWNQHDAVIQVFNSEEAVDGRYYVEEGRVQNDISQINRRGKSEDVSTDDKLPGGGGGSECVWVHEYCDDPNWTCLAGIAVTTATCGWLTMRSGFAEWAFCLSGAGVSLMQAMDQENCSVCDDVDARTLNVCDEKWHVSPP